MAKVYSNQKAVSAPETWDAYHDGRVITEADIEKKSSIGFVDALLAR